MDVVYIQQNAKNRDARRTLRIRRSSAVRGRASRSLNLALPVLPDSIRNLHIRLVTAGVEATDLRV
jgi:hypothetical protein